MRKTKIVCTIGPACDNKEVLQEMVKSGLNVARLNFSHGNYQEHQKRIDLIKEIEAELDIPLGIILDTRGPEIRTGKLKEEEVKLVKGEEITLTTREIVGDSSRISISYKNITEDIDVGNHILISDGLLELEVLAIKGDELRCRILNGGRLGSQKGVNLPGVSVNLPALTEKDREDIKFGIQQGVHFIAASFVRRAENVLEIKDLLAEEDGEEIGVIAKIESQQAVDNIDKIIEAADGVMIARGDLGVEIPPERVPVIQKEIIQKCNRASKPVITATQMLESMIHNPRPTRAEASDVANAIFDGTDAIMLSGESAIGDYPLETVKTMARIAEEVERSPGYWEKMESFRTLSSPNVTDAISLSACETAIDLDASLIISSTSSGLTARMVSKYRPRIQIIGVTYTKIIRNKMSLFWGVHPIKVKVGNSTDEMIDNALNAILDYKLALKGDLVTITAGVPVGCSGTTNLIEVLHIGE